MNLAFLRLGGHPPSQHVDEWKDYKTLASPQAAHSQKDQWSSSIYRGLVPAENITKRDFAINGAFISSIADSRTFAFTPHKWTVHHEQWIHIRGDRALDIVVHSWALPLHGRTSTGRDGEEGSLDKEANPDSPTRATAAGSHSGRAYRCLPPSLCTGLNSLIKGSTSSGRSRACGRVETGSCGRSGS